MKLRPIDSDMLIAAGYDQESRVLQVVFRTGGTYRYKNVPSDKYVELMNSDSIGQYMHNHIIGHYDYERV